MFRLAATKAAWLSTVLIASGVRAQTCLVLSPATISPEGTASQDLSLVSAPGVKPAAVQWTFQYQASSIRTLTVDDGPALTSVGKTAICAGDASAYRCITVGASTKPIANGVIARLTAVLAAGATAPLLAITNPMAVSAAGYMIPTFKRSGSIADADILSGCKPTHPSGSGVK
jgi:hypothetical protein